MSTPPKLVLGFDSWTKGRRHFKRLLPELEARGLGMKVVHLGSWGNEKQAPTQEFDEGLEINDIRHYRKQSLEYVLDTEKPDMVVFLSINTFAHRAFKRYCKARNIPTFHLYHGLLASRIRLDEARVKVEKESKLSTAQLKYNLSRLGKIVFQTIPTYGRALAKTKATREEWKRLFTDLRDMFRGNHNDFDSLYAPDTHTDHCFVYTASDIGHAQLCYNQKENEVSAVGNPDLIQFDIDEEHFLSNPEVAGNTYMYLMTGYLSLGEVFDDHNEYLNHIRDTSKELAKIGAKLSLRLHPAYDETLFKERLSDCENVELAPRTDFINQLKACKGCIVEPTSLGIVPIILGMPIYLARYDKLQLAEFGDMYLEYPRSNEIQKRSKLSVILSQPATYDKESLLDWIKNIAGPTPPGLMGERVVEKMIEVHREIT